MSDKLTHISSDGAANMVDVGDKAQTKRAATAQGHIKMHPETLKAVLAGDMKKGDVIGVARIAGIMAAKRTHDLIPLCHQLALSSVDVQIEANNDLPGLNVSATAKLTGQTGVEMEALTAVTVACLTLYDMAKAMDRDMEIGGITLISKTGGKSAN